MWTFVLLTPLSFSEQAFKHKGVQILVLYFAFSSFGGILRSAITGSSGNSLFTMLKNYNRIFCSRYTILHSHQDWLKCSNFFTALSILVFFFFFLKKKYKLLLKGEMWYLIVVLTWISLIISDVEDIFLCLLAICINIYK